MTVAPPFLTRVCISNYKSIAACDVNLGSLAFLVGPNGSGKSNFLDAIRFVTDALDTTLDHALRDRGGIGEVRRRSRSHPRNFEIRLEFHIPDGPDGHYSFKIESGSAGGFSVKDEECIVAGPELTDHASFRVSNTAQEVETSLNVAMPAVMHDRLYLVAISANEPFWSVYDALVRMRFYNLNPGIIREPQKPNPDNFLKHEGGNLASVLASLRKQHPKTMERIEQYLGSVVPGINSVKRISPGAHEMIEFNQTVPGQKKPWRFRATSMSDGTLRVLGILTALLQNNSTPPTFVGIEEPEIALHPAALAALIDAFQDAKRQTQVIVTTHSTDLLHFDAVRTDELLGVSAETGATVIGRVDQGSRKALHDRLFTAGDLLRLNKLPPDKTTVSSSRQIKFFDL